MRCVRKESSARHALTRFHILVLHTCMNATMDLHPVVIMQENAMLAAITVLAITFAKVVQKESTMIWPDIHTYQVVKIVQPENILTKMKKNLNQIAKMTATLDLISKLTEVPVLCVKGGNTRTKMISPIARAVHQERQTTRVGLVQKHIAPPV